MTNAPVQAAPEMRTNSLALAFQEVFIVILRTRFRVQQVESSEAFRAHVKNILSQSARRSASAGYSDQATKMAMFATIAFLDESVLNSGNPVFEDWPRRPLQVEMFGGNVAGEAFFYNLTELLNRSESAEVADALELHALCLLLGYRGRAAYGDVSEVHTLLRRIRDKITRIRGAAMLFRPAPPPAAPPAAKPDPWIRRLVLTAAMVTVLTVLAYVVYTVVLSKAGSAALHTPASTAAHSETELAYSSLTGHEISL